MSKIHWGSLLIGIALAIAIAWAVGRRKLRVTP